MQLREAREGDGQGIAQVNVASWQSTYRGLLPDSILNNLSIENKAVFWEKVIIRGIDFVYVAEDEQGQIVGYVSGGASREAGYDGELYAIYLLKAVQGQGIGRKLVHTFIQRLIDSGYVSMVIWVLDGNPARHFYEALGGRFVKRKTEIFGHMERDELAYAWDDVRSILK